MAPSLMMLATALAVVLAILGIYSFLADIFLRDRVRIGQRLDEEFRKRQRQQARNSTLFKNLSSFPAGSFEDVLPTPGQRLAELVEQSGLLITVNRLLTLMLVGGLSLGVLLGAIRQSPLAQAIGLVLGASAPYLYVARKRRLRLAALTAQLPDAFDLMCRSVRAGQSLPRAIYNIVSIEY